MACGTNFVLIHGAWCGSWIWDDVAQLLRTQGYRVFAPTLAGLAERSAELDASITRETHASEVVELFEREGLQDAVLVGHSYGGFVISDAIGRLPEGAVRALVYLDGGTAPFPPPGDYENNFPPFEIVDDAIMPQSAQDMGYEGRIGALLEEKCTPMPRNALFQPAMPTPAVQEFPDKTFVWGSESGQGVWRAYHGLWSADPGWKTDIVKAGHCMMLDAPEEAAAAICRAGGLPGYEKESA